MNRHARQRARMRGAAMVEGLVMIPVLLLFWMGVGYFADLHDARLATMAVARVEHDSAHFKCAAASNPQTSSDYQIPAAIEVDRSIGAMGAGAWPTSASDFGGMPVPTQLSLPIRSLTVGADMSAAKTSNGFAIPALKYRSTLACGDQPPATGWTIWDTYPVPMQSGWDLIYP